MAIAVLGIDLGKNSCSVVGQDGTGQVILRLSHATQKHCGPRRKALAVRHCNGGLLWCPSS